MLNTLSARGSATVVALVLLAIIVGAFVFEWAGYPPCELCLMQRWAYYVGVPFAGFLALAKPGWIKPGLWVLSAVLTANAVFGVFHAGIEWGW
jgi:disulfide bond formation protein DsbB